MFKQPGCGIEDQVHPGGRSKEVIQAVVDFLLTYGFAKDSGFYKDMPNAYLILKDVSEDELRSIVRQVPSRDPEYIRQFLQDPKDLVKITHRQTRQNPPPRPHAPTGHGCRSSSSTNLQNNDQHYGTFNREQIGAMVQFMLLYDYGEDKEYLLDMQYHCRPVFANKTVEELTACAMNLSDQGKPYIYQFCTRE